MAGMSLADLVAGGSPEVGVFPSLEAAIEASPVRPDVAVVTTVSSIARILPTIRQVAEQKLNIVTTCEELSYPWRQHPEEAQEIDRICRTHSVTCLGTGVNPGFLMDYLPAVLSSIHQRVDHILVERVQDASVRRVPFQKKIGAGYTLEEFEREKARGTLRHVGLPESLDMVAAAMDWRLDQTDQTLEPVLAEADLHTGYKPIRQGDPAGVEQVATGRIGGREVIRLRFRAAVGEEKSYDRIFIQGSPGAELSIAGGIHGDIATSAITANAIRSAARAQPGLQTMLDVSTPTWFAGRARETSDV
jgi:2,4-diaminopentanoate dehydrogenase